MSTSSLMHRLADPAAAGMLAAQAGLDDGGLPGGAGFRPGRQAGLAAAGPAGFAALASRE